VPPWWTGTYLPANVALPGPLATKPPRWIGTYLPVNVALPGPLATKLSMPAF
jgi:hypothetical protein